MSLSLSPSPVRFSSVKMPVGCCDRKAQGEWMACCPTENVQNKPATMQPKSSQSKPEAKPRLGFLGNIVDWFKHFFSGMFKDLKRIFRGSTSD